MGQIGHRADVEEPLLRIARQLAVQETGVAVDLRRPLVDVRGVRDPAAFDVLLRFFEGEENAERKALALCSPFAALAIRRVGPLSEDAVAVLVMEVLIACLDNPEVEYVFGERRDDKRDVDAHHRSIDTFEKRS